MNLKRSNSSAPQKQGWHPAWLALLSSLWLSSAGNIALWSQVHQLPEVSGLRGFAFAIGFGAIITAAISAILSFLNWRWLLKPAIAVFFLSAASGAYFMMSYGIVIDSTMITNVVQTDAKEALDFGKHALALRALCKGDYRKLCELFVYLLGGDVPGFKFHQPGACHEARFMADGLNLLTLHLTKNITNIMNYEEIDMVQEATYNRMQKVDRAHIQGNNNRDQGAWPDQFPRALYTCPNCIFYTSGCICIE